MSKITKLFLGLLISLAVFYGCENSLIDESFSNDIDLLLLSKGLTKDDVIDITSRVSSGNAISREAKCINHCGRFKFSLVKIGGRVNHFGYDITQTPPMPIPFKQNVSGVSIWISEYPVTKYFGLETDETGFWKAWILKRRGVDIGLSFIYEKEGWITTKSNVITITDEDNLDIAIQFIDPLYYNLGVKPMVEGMLLELTGQTIPLMNAIVATVGKSWASMHDVRLPHGDPGAIATINGEYYLPGIIGPVYFNDQVQPDPELVCTSVDGGVAFINQPLGTYMLSALKPDVAYEIVTFEVSQEDINNGVVLYIASPPDSIQGDNDSEPGQW